MSRAVWLTELSLLTALGLSPSVALPDETLPQAAVGPRSDAEAELLWQELQTAHDASGKAQACLHAADRFLHRYPTHPQRSLAHVLAGDCALNTGKLTLARERYAAVARSRAELPLRARAQVGLLRAHFESRHYESCVATSLELPKKLDAHEARAKEDLLRILAYRSRCHLKLGHAREAAQARDFADSIATKDQISDPRARSELALARLEVSLDACARFLESGSLTESQALGERKALGTCLVDSLKELRDVLSYKVAATAESARDAFDLALGRAVERCGKPPTSPDKQLTPSERSTYEKELALKLKNECGPDFSSLLELTRSWTKELSSEVTPLVESLRKKIQKSIDALKSR